MAEVRPQIKSSVDVIVEYKKGNIGKDQAIQKFAALTGLSWDLATSFIEPLSKRNIVKFPAKSKE
tara:strand:+ start:1333 stop:1527 length:195 start_codon:yes stop_codon:yes gene_type:complete